MELFSILLSLHRPSKSQAEFQRVSRRMPASFVSVSSDENWKWDDNEREEKEEKRKFSKIYYKSLNSNSLLSLDMKMSGEVRSFVARSGRWNDETIKVMLRESSARDG